MLTGKCLQHKKGNKSVSMKVVQDWPETDGDIHCQ